MLWTRRSAILFFWVCGFDEGFDAATTPRCSRSCSAEPPGKLAEDCAIRTCGGQEDTDAGRTLDHAGGDFDQTKAQRRELRNRERRALCDRIARGEHEPISGGVQDQPELVGLGFATRGAIRGELSLVPLDEVLGLAAAAVDGLVEMLCRALERGDDVADVETLQRGFDARSDAALLIPALGAVTQHGEGAQLCRGTCGTLDAQHIGGFLGHGFEYRVAAKAKNVVDALLFAPFHRFDPAIMAVAADEDFDFGPVNADAPDHVLEDGAHLHPGGRLALAPDHRHRLARGSFINV